MKWNDMIVSIRIASKVTIQKKVPDITFKEKKLVIGAEWTTTIEGQSVQSLLTVKSMKLKLQIRLEGSSI